MGTSRSLLKWSTNHEFVKIFCNVIVQCTQLCTVWKLLKFTFTFFGKNFVNLTFFLKQLLKNWFHEIFSRLRRISRFSTLCCGLREWDCTFTILYKHQSSDLSNFFKSSKAKHVAQICALELHIIVHCSCYVHNLGVSLHQQNLRNFLDLDFPSNQNCTISLKSISKVL